jgi:hypothetical protein
MTSQAVKESTIKLVIREYERGNFPAEVLTELGIKHEENSHPEVIMLSHYVVAEDNEVGGIT